MSLNIEIKIVKKTNTAINLSTPYNYLISYLKAGELVGTLEFQVDTIQVSFRKHCLINVGAMKVPSEIDKASLMVQTKITICRYFWKTILFQKVYIWSDSTVCEMDFSSPVYSNRQELTFCKTFQAILSYIGEKYYNQPRDWTAHRKAEVMYMRHDLMQAIPLFVAANPLHRDGAGLINFGQVSSLDLLG